ncbi:MAG: DUF84 family protein [Ignavibacteriales bacterium]|nr:DUF84 family protein [Ignavibacteriales bacterium]
MIIRIASTRLPKVNGVKKAVEKLIRHFHMRETEVQFETTQGKSGVSEMPLTLEETMRGARQRAESIFEPGKVDISVGVEGGLFQIEEKVFLQSWTCVYDGVAFYYGGSGSIELPQSLAYNVLHGGEMLGDAIDKFSRQVDVRSNQGTFGVLTNDLISREDSFELSATNAFIPLFNSNAYGSSRNK